MFLSGFKDFSLMKTPLETFVKYQPSHFVTDKYIDLISDLSLCISNVKSYYPVFNKIYTPAIVFSNSLQ